MTRWTRRTGPATAFGVGLVLALSAATVAMAQVSVATGASVESVAPVSGETVARQLQAAHRPGADASTWRGVLDRYCVTCHNERLLTGNLALDDIDMEHVGADAEVWEKVLRKLRTQAMPPPRRPRPDAETYGAFATWLETALDRAAAAEPNPGRPTIHRLNRLEYANTVRDLLHLEIDSGTMLPADDLAYGFDNNADILTVAPGLLERYMSAARKVSRLAVGDPTIEADAGLVSVMAQTPLARSRAAARRLVQSKAVRVNGQLTEDIERTLSPANALYGVYHLIRRGKKSWHLVAHG